MLLSHAIRGILLLTGTLSLGLSGCGESNDMQAHAVDASVSAIELDPGDASVFHLSDLKLPYKTSKACIAHATERGAPEERASCQCKSCLEHMQECDVLPGCLEIVACANKSGCNGAFACYLFPGAPCTEVVDRWGNASVATTVSLELMDCSTKNKCN